MKFGIASHTANVSTQITFIQLLAAANRAFELHQLVLGFGGAVSTDAPVDVELVYQSDAGTGGSALNSNELSNLNFDSGDALSVTGISEPSSEPTGTIILFNTHVHPQSGLIWQPPAPIIIPEAKYLGLRLAAATSVNCRAALYFGE